MRGLIGLLVVVWLVIGAVAAGQRGYFDGNNKEMQSCNRIATIAVTVVAGPLNYVGVDPKINCDQVDVPQPSNNS